jgi:hypothetical protein
MNECQEEYNRLLLLSRWGACTEQEEHIIMLQAEIEYLKSSHTKMPKNPKLIHWKVEMENGSTWQRTTLEEGGRWKAIPLVSRAQILDDALANRLHPDPSRKETLGHSTK